MALGGLVARGDGTVAAAAAQAAAEAAAEAARAPPGGTVVVVSRRGLCANADQSQGYALRKKNYNLLKKQIQLVQN